MSDEIEFEEEKDPEVEFVDEADVPKDPDDELPEDVKKLSKKELYERMKAAEGASPPDPTERITKAVTDAFGKVVAPAPAPVQAPGESDNAFRERLKKDLFDEEKAEGVLNEAIDRRLGPRLAQTLDLTYRQAEKIMELDPETGPIFKRYRGEITDYITKNFPAEVRRNPQALEIAYKQVMVAHLDEIAQEKANAILAEAKKTETPRRAPLPLEGSPGPSTPRKKIVGITQEDRRVADERGVDASVIAAQRAARMS